MIEAGTVLQQRYRIDRQIGQGGMGAVYIATDERFGSVVAIKETLFMDANFRKAIEREARLLNSLRHAALPRVSDHFEENDSQFLVMEYIQGEDLGHVLDESKTPFPVEDVVKWADQLLDALDFLHNQDIPVIHRDIKPQNLKLTAAGQIILLDFGLAKGNPTDAGHQTAAKSIFGYSRNYASLEQIQGTGTDPRSDLYSLGATLYHLITGFAPDDALTRAMSVLAGRTDPLRPANAFRSEVSRGVAGVLRCSMDLNAEGRPNSAVEMRQMFRESENYAYLADLPAVSSTPTDARVFAQATRLMADTTNVGAVSGEAKTEVLPAFISEETSLRIRPNTGGNGVRDTAADAANASPPPRARRLAPILASLVLVGAAMGGGALYLNSTRTSNVPSAEQSNSPAPAASAASNSTLPVTPVEPPAAGIANTSGEDVINTNSGGDRAKAKTGTKQADSAKGSKPASADRSKNPDETIEIQGAPDEEDIPGDVVVTKRNPDGSTTTTRVLKNTGGKNSKVAPARPGNFPFDMRYMTPEQRRKLRKVMRPDGTIIIPPIPPNQQQ